MNINNQNYSSRDGVLFSKAGDTLIAYPAGLKGQYAIPTSVTRIWHWAFSDCTGLITISIPASVTEINMTAFEGCTGLTSIQVDANNNHYTSRNGVLFNKSATVLIAYPAGLKGQYAIPASVTSIWHNAFYGCTGLTSVSIPTGVTRIESHSFFKCTGLTAITIPASVSYIGTSAFNGCTGLTSVSIPASVTDIANYVFSGCTGLTSISIGANVNVGWGGERDPFDWYYLDNDKKAGVYTFRNGAWSYAAQ